MQDSRWQASQPIQPGIKLSPEKARILDLYTSARIQDIEEAAIELEWNGFAIDPEYFGAQAKVARSDLDAIDLKLSGLLAAAGVVHPNPEEIWSSPKQLVDLLHDQLGIPPAQYWFKGRVKVDDGQRKTDRTALEWLLGQLEAGVPSCAGANPQARGIVEGLMERRRVLSSLKYLEKLPRYIGPDGFVHPVCGPAGDEDDRVGAITGRFGMKAPEAQQIPRDKRKDLYHIRRGFIAPPGQLLVVRDYTALEVVILANICEWLFGDTTLLELTAPGQDIHAYNAFNVYGRFLDWRTPSGRSLKSLDVVAEPGNCRGLEVFKEDPELSWYREEIKKVWYKLQYGGTVHGFGNSLKDQAGNPIGKSRAGEIVEALYRSVPGVPKWQDWVRTVLVRDGGISALDGRYVDYSDLIARGDWGMSAAERKADNFPLQATGAHVIGCAMSDATASRELAGLGALLELQVHDELRWRAPADQAEAVSGLADEIMCGAFPLKNLRTAGGIGLTWEDCK